MDSSSVAVSSYGLWAMGYLGLSFCNLGQLADAMALLQNGCATSGCETGILTRIIAIQIIIPYTTTTFIISTTTIYVLLT